METTVEMEAPLWESLPIQAAEEELPVEEIVECAVRTLSADGKKGITVKVDEALHAEIRQALESQGITMSEFVSLALKEWLHPSMQKKGETTMGYMRTLAFQVPEDLFWKIEDYLQRNKMTQKDFVIGLIEAELERDLAEREGLEEAPMVAEETVSEESEGVSEGLEEEMPEISEETISEEVETVPEESGDVSEGPEEPVLEGENLSESEEVEVMEGAMCPDEEVSGYVEEEEEIEEEEENVGLSMGMRGEMESRRMRGGNWRK